MLPVITLIRLPNVNRITIFIKVDVYHNVLREPIRIQLLIIVSYVIHTVLVVPHLNSVSLVIKI